MQVCIIGDATEPLDEGMKKVTFALTRGLSECCDVRLLSPLEALSPGFWVSLSKCRPDVIHYVPGPSLYSFVLLKLAKLWTSAATVMSLTHPDPNLPWSVACRFFGPDLLLTQSLQLEKLVRSLGCDVRYVPNGVDTRVFRSVSVAEKMRLRREYGVPHEAFVVLHVGNTRHVRNLDVLVDLQQGGCQVIVVSSTTIQGDMAVGHRLVEAGCLLWNRYIESIHEVYALADCYVFPTPTGVGAIDHPLSVVEAMACNLPVVTRRFGALPRAFEPGDGLYFVETDDELKAAVEHVRCTAGEASTRAKVMGMDWDAIASQVAALYDGLDSVERQSH